MPFATAHTVALNGALGHLIDVQVDVSPGQANVAMVGRADTALREGQERIRMAIHNSGLHWPVTKRTTILLSPADLPKSGTHFDLAMAVSVLGADGQLPASALHGAGFIGELTLSGGLRPAVGVLPMVMAVADRGVRRVFVPEPQSDEAAMVPDVEVLGVRSLAQVVALLKGEEVPSAPPVAASSGTQLLTWRGEERLDELDMADLHGLVDVKYAVEVAAAGGHAVLLSGPKGAGKTSIAERIPTILPDLTDEESLELTAVHSLAGVLPPGAERLRRPLFRAPHHSASRSGILGGGTGRVRPGEVSRAHLGVLFLDEFPLFPVDVIEALREPLESGEISISRGDDDAVYPARAMFVFACNPCRCGAFHPFARDHQCTCSEVSRREYRAKISGPIADRIDITRFVEPMGRDDLLPFERRESSAEIRVRVEAARERQRQRYAGLPWRLNVHAPGPTLREQWPLTDTAMRRLEDEVYTGRLTRRGSVRVHRVAWSVADLAGVVQPGPRELDVALRLRRADPLALASIPRQTSVQERPA